MKIDNLTEHPTTIAVVYKHLNSSTIDKFITDLSCCITEFHTNKKTFFILEDININISSKNRILLTKHYLNMLTGSCCFPLNTIPTKVSNDATTIIDHILTNDISHRSTPGIFDKCEMSDHWAMFCLIHNLKIKTNKNPTNFPLYFRDKSNFQPDLYCYDLHIALKLFFAEIPQLTTDNYNSVFDKVSKIVLLTIDKHAPLKYHSRRQKNC